MLSNAITVAFLIVSIILTEVLVLKPLEWFGLGWLHLPGWLGLAGLGLLLSWCLGD
ncbi:MAG: hypothetical protein ACFBSC_18695 [Microcoleaceae cyanobacterium]